MEKHAKRRKLPETSSGSLGATSTIALHKFTWQRILFAYCAPEAAMPRQPECQTDVTQDTELRASVSLPLRSQLGGAGAAGKSRET